MLLLAACQTLQADYSPKITFVVVQKRHHTRFFAMDKKDADTTGNCLPGTVVERDITSPIEFDFCKLSLFIYVYVYIRDLCIYIYLYLYVHENT